MFSKTLFLFVLFCAVVFANGETESKVESRDRSVKIQKWRETADAFFKSQAKKIHNVVHNVRKKVQFWIDRISGKEHAIDEEKLAALQEQLGQSEAEWSKKLNDNTVYWQVQIAELQKDLEAARHADAETFQAKVQALNEALLQSNKEYERLRNSFSQVIQGVRGEIEKAGVNQ